VKDGALSHLVVPLAAFLPESVAVRDVAVVETQESATSAHARAVLALRGPMASRALVGRWTRTYEFVAVPSLRSPRALVPAEDRGASRTLLMPRSAGASQSRRAAARVLRLLPTTVLTCTGRSVALAVDEVSPVAGVLERVAPRATFGVYLGNSRNAGRYSVQAFSSGQPVAVAKVVAESEGRERVAHECEVLDVLSTISALAHTVPVKHEHLTVRAGEVLVTDAFGGEPCPISRTPLVRAWLDACRIGPPRLFSHSPLLRRALASAMDSDAHELARLAAEAVADTRVDRTVVHGDFVPWNIRVDRGRLRVFDWEYGCVDGVPAWDELFFEAQVALVLRGADAASLAAILTSLWHTGNRTYKHYLCAVAIIMLADLAGRYVRRGDPVLARRAADAAAQLASAHHGGRSRADGDGRRSVLSHATEQ
jgi:hypothetical protein